MYVNSSHTKIPLYSLLLYGHISAFCTGLCTVSSWGFACHNRKEPPNTALVNKARLWCPADQHINSAHAMERDSREVVASGYDKGKHVILAG